jgi:hypothetical protein
MRYLLIDANHLASRCRHSGSGKTLMTSAGVHSGTLFGTLRGVSWAKNQTKVDWNRVICCWDYGRAAGRMELYPDYKSGRDAKEKTPEEVLETKSYYSQLDAALDGLRCAGIRQVRVGGVEADDLISIFTNAFVANGDDVVVFSGDRTFYSLVGDQVSVLDSDKGLLDEAGVLAEWPVPSISSIPLYRAVVGKPLNSDGIEGVPGIGKKLGLSVLPYPHLLVGNDPQPRDVPDKTWKLIEKSRCHADIIARNMTLMSLPKDWAGSFYTPEQAAEAVSQLRGEGLSRSMRRFIAFLREWELTSILEAIHLWQ